MNDTREIVDQIISEIESTDPTSGKTISQVMEQLLGRKVDVQPTVQEQPAEPPKPVNSRIDLEELRRWRDKNNQTYLVNTDHELRSELRIGARIELFVKRVIRKLIRPIIYSIVAEQNEFNASVTLSINALYNNDEVLASLLDEFEEEKAKNQALKAELEQLQKKYNKQFPRSIYELIDYSRFEQNFRGSEEDIRAAQEVYLPYFAGANKVLDLGCGRGEFLELLQENNIPAQGIDLYEPFVEECRGKGLDVTEGDAINSLAQMESESLDGIYSAQLIEHITPFELVQLCREAYDKLKTGGKLILETPNPTCLSVYTNAFYIDPTHKNPVHPKTLEYYCRDAGFHTVEILFPEKSRVNYRLPLLNTEYAVNLAEFNDGINCLTDLIFGSQNYAIVATK